MITLHHLNNSRSQRILWMLEELSLPYEIRFYQRDPKTMLAPAELKRVHPLGKAPVLTDGDLTLAESAVILDYLVSTYGNGRFVPAAASPARADYTYFMAYAEASAMPPLLLKLVFARLAGSMPWPLRPVAGVISKAVQKRFIDDQLRTHMVFIEQHLSGQPWFAGEEFSAADVQMSFPIEALAVRGPSDVPAAAMREFLKRIHGRAAYQAATARGGALELVS